MAIPHTAEVVAVAPFGPRGCLVTLDWAAAPGFVGGQYVIVDSGRLHPSGKPAKRAYSIVSSDRAPARIELAVKRVGGPTSSYLHEVRVGDAVRFTGPWGQFVPAPAAAPSLVLVTDTGITAALGLVNAAAFADRRAGSHLVWFVDEELATPARLVERAAGITVHLEAGGHDRVRRATDRALALIARHRLEAVYLAGDGAVVHPVRAALVAAGVAEAAIGVEGFFNNPIRKAP